MYKTFMLAMMLTLAGCSPRSPEKAPDKIPDKTTGPAEPRPGSPVGDDAGQPAKGTPDPAGTSKVTVAFSLEELPAGEVDQPRQKIGLVVTEAGKPSQTVALGEFEGCGLREQTRDYPGALLLVSCWWAGAGDDLFLVREDDALIVRRVEKDEGSAETGAVISKPQEVARVPVPKGAEIQVAKTAE